MGAMPYAHLGEALATDYFLVRDQVSDDVAIHTFEGTETMQALIVGRDITGIGAFR